MDYTIGEIIKYGTRHPVGIFGAVLRRMAPKDAESSRISAWRFGKLPREHITKILPGIENVNVNIQKTFNRLIGTSIDPNEILILAAIVKHIKAKKVVEIGTYDGNTALNIAANMPDNGKVITIDMPQEWETGTKIKIPKNYVNVNNAEGKRVIVGNQYHNTKENKKIKQIFCDSAKLDWKTLNGPFDMVFIDGCHHYKYVKHDTKMALRNLKSGGVIVWHDYGAVPDVSKAVDELKSKIRLYAIRGTRFAIGFLK